MGLLDRFRKRNQSGNAEDSAGEAVTGTFSFKGFGATARARVSEFITKLKEKFPRNVEDLKKLRIDETFERVRHLGSTGSGATYLRLGAAAFAAYFLADTVSLFTDSLIPDPPAVPAPQVARKTEKRRSMDEYAQVFSRNIFNSQGIIPEDGTGSMASGPARKTSLPLNLVGTMVLKDELKSIASIEDKSQNLVFPVRIDDTIGDKIQITKIQHLRVEFINKSTGMLEFVEIIDDQPGLSTRAMSPTTSGRSGSAADGIQQLGEGQVQVDRAVIDKAMGNLGEVLQQAHAMPNFENGMPDGYKILQIVPGSIYDKIGIKNGDIITGLNGEPINDPGKAFQLFNELRSTNHVDIKVKRNGRTMNMNFDIR